VFAVNPAAADHALAALEATRKRRDAGRAKTALAELEARARAGEPIMEASIACALARVTTGEWAGTLRGVWGEYRAATGVAGARIAVDGESWTSLRARVDAHVQATGRRPRLLVGKPGLDGHSNGAEQVAVRARDAGMDVVYDGIRLTPEEIVDAARDKDVHVVGLSILSGSHMPLVKDVVTRMRAAGLDDVPVVVGGIIPPDDAAALTQSGVAAVYTPKDFELNRMMSDVLRIVERSNAGEP